MSVAKHVILDHGGLSSTDGLRVAILNNVANVAGSGAGAAVATAVLFGDPLPDALYTVTCNPGQDATWYVSAKTKAGFTLNLTPRLAANTLAAGHFDLAVFE